MLRVIRGLIENKQEWSESFNCLIADFRKSTFGELVNEDELKLKDKSVLGSISSNNAYKEMKIFYIYFSVRLLTARNTLDELLFLIKKIIDLHQTYHQGKITQEEIDLLFQISSDKIPEFPDVITEKIKEYPCDLGLFLKEIYERREEKGGSFVRKYFPKKYKLFRFFWV